MATKPTVLPKWAEDDQIDPVSGESNVYEPPENRKLSGWNRREIPPRQWFNWLARYYYRWILWAKEKIEGSDSLILGSVSDVSAIDPTKISQGQEAILSSWASGYNLGGGAYYVDLSRPQIDHNGGSILALGISGPTDFTSTTQISNYLNAGSSATGTGCLVKIPGCSLTSSVFGARPDLSDSGFILKKMWEVAAGGKTEIDSSIIVTTPIDTVDVDIDCHIPESSIIDCSGMPTGTALGQQYFFKASGSVADSSAVTADVQKFSDNRSSTSSDSVITVADGSKFTAGDTVFLRSDQLFDDAWTGGSGNKRGELLKVKSVSVNDVVVGDRIKFSYLASQNAVLEKLAPISFNWSGGKAIGGGVGEAHSFIKVDTAENVKISGYCEHFEDTGLELIRVYGADVRFSPNYCTSPSALGNTGYGVAVVNGSRYIDVWASGIQCRHIVAGGGAYPALNTRVSGFAKDCGIGTNAWDCHEPCFDWDFDVVSQGGDGGVVVRGSDITVSMESYDGAATGLRVRTFQTVTEQKNINIKKAIVRNHKGAAILIQGINNPISNVTAALIKTRNTRLDGVLISGTASAINLDSVDINGTFLNSGESSTSGVGFRLSGTAKSISDVVIGRLYVANTTKESILIEESERVSIGEIKCSSPTGLAVCQVNDCNEVKVLGGYIDAADFAFSGLATERCDNVQMTNTDIIGDLTKADQDGWRATDTNGGRMSGCRVLCSRSGGYVTGISDRWIVVGNDFVDVAGADKFNQGPITNIVEANNLS